MQGKGTLLLVDDDEGVTAALANLLTRAGYTVHAAHTAASALDVLRREPTDLCLLDLRLGATDGLELLPQLKAIRREMSVIVLTALGTVEKAVEAMRLGTDNFLVKPVDPPRLLALVAKGLESRALRRRNEQLERLGSSGDATVLGTAPLMREALDLAAAVAARDTTVLICGETGTGKGVLARRIHELSRRRSAACVSVNCAGLPRELTESELFGHEKGAFTGAAERKLGLFEAADGGTLFLDEIGEMETGIQAKLLKVLEERRFRRVGGITEVETDVRLLAATHRDLVRDVAAGRFRQDLLYRLNVFVIALPALRQRREDIPLLAAHFLRELSGAPVAIRDDAMEELVEYSWPGNVRELRNVMERAAILCPPGQPVGVEHLPALDEASPLDPAEPASPLRQQERQLIEAALQHHGGNIRAAAKELGISRGTIYRRLKAYSSQH